jgi:hypothetical protein
MAGLVSAIRVFGLSVAAKAWIARDKRGHDE